MPNVAEIVREHVALTVDCVDRLYLNAYVPRLQGEGGVKGFLHHRGQRIPSPVLFAELTAAFKASLHQLCEGQGIPWLEFQKRERKDDVVQRYRQDFGPSAHWVSASILGSCTWNAPPTTAV